MSATMRTLLLVGLPYAAIVVFVAGVMWRRRSRFTISSLSSQVMESRWLAWGTIPFHLGIGLIVFGHLIPLLIPRQWQALTSNRTSLLVVETIGSGAAILAVVGLLVLLVRRVFTAAVRSSTTFADVAVLLILIAQVALGLGVATMHRWGAIWSGRTTTPYLWSLFTLHPDPAFLAGVPTLVIVHVALAWVVLALIPFTRLIHMFSVPLGHLTRSPQKVVWVTPPPSRRSPEPNVPDKETAPLGTVPQPKW